MVEEELRKSNLTLDVILGGNLQDVLDLCNENKFPNPVRIYLVKAYKDSKPKAKKQENTNSNDETTPEPNPKQVKAKPKPKKKKTKKKKKKKKKKK